MSITQDVLDHSTLCCSLRGVPSASTIQFRNLKYAAVPTRFKDAALNELFGVGIDGIVDATQFGPSCPHKLGAQAWDLTLLGKVTLPCEPGQGNTERMHEHDCLQLNITVPRPTIDAAKPTNMRRLPVFVWVHGGGLSIGSNNWPQYDLRRFVERSVEIGKPVVGVCVNYRLNVFGFLASEEIGAAGNMGYKDQVLAFQWIKKHIAGFGGDPNNITAAGESAGGISLSTQLCANVSGEGLFDRVVIMSGEATLRKSRNKGWHQKMYQDQKEHLGLEEEKGVVCTRTILLNTDAEELAQKLPLAQYFAGTIDGHWLTQDFSIETLSDPQCPIHKPSWCKEFVVGDTAHDGTILKANIWDHPRVLERLEEACNAYLSASETHDLLSAYHLENMQSSQHGVAERILELVSELRFYLPALAVHRGWKACSPAKRAFRYHFHIPNPFEGDFKGLASHELDVAYLLQNFNDHFDEHNRKLAHGMADHFIRFATGGSWVDEGKVIVFGTDGVVEVEEQEYDSLYRNGRGNVLERIGARKLWLLVESWQGVQKEDTNSDSP